MAAFSVSLRSGSSGNSTFVRTDSAGIAVDCGMSGRQFALALEAVGQSARQVDALLLTHEHIDHCSGVGVVMRRHKIPLYLTEDTFLALRNDLGPLPDSLVFLIEPGKAFQVKDTEIQPFSIPHDALDPVGFRIRTSEGDIGIATDLGYFSQEIREALTGCRLVHLESNFDPQMLEEGSYPRRLKDRIASARGHLSNEEAGMAAAWLIQRGTQALALSHLSEENNRPQLAQQVVSRYLESMGAREGQDYRLTVSARYQVSRPLYCAHPIQEDPDPFPDLSGQQLTLFGGERVWSQGGGCDG